MSTVLLCFLVLFATTALAQRTLPPIELPSGPTPGVRERCDLFESCVPFSSRISFSADFLCCEDGSGWTVAHILNPAIVFLYFGNFVTAWFIAFLFEVFEVLVLMAFGDFIVFQTDDLQIESWAGSVVGDAFVQGGIGVFLAWLLVSVTSFRPMFANWARMPGLLRAKYLFMWFAQSCSFILLRFYNERLNWGLLLTLGINTLLLAVVYPLITSSDSDVRYVWRTRDSTASRDRGFRLFIVVLWLVGAQSVGFQYLANDWFQSWVGATLAIVFLLVFSGCRQRGLRQSTRASLAANGYR